MSWLCASGIMPARLMSPTVGFTPTRPHTEAGETMGVIYGKRWVRSLEELAEALKYWYKKTKKKVTYEYVVWKGINDTEEHAVALLKFCKHVPCKVNLIEYNPIDDGEFQQASEESLNMYMHLLESNGVTTRIRKSRGKDIDAACGQLANKS